MKSILPFFKYIFLICLAFYLLMVLVPREYNVPSLQANGLVKYWKLSTGSDIAYIMIPARGSRKPFPVIYLHGGPGGHTRDEVVKTLASLADQGYDLYFYDQIGSGRSARLKDISEYTVSRHIADLAAITETLGKRRVILIGQSWGAILATFFTARYPEKVERLILTSPGPIYPVHRELADAVPPESVRLKAPLFTNAAGNMKAGNMRTQAMNFLATRFEVKLAGDKEADKFATYLSYEVDKSTVCDTTNILPMDPGGGYYAQVMTFNDLLHVQDVRPALAHVATPVLVMKGECDNQPWGFTSEYLHVFKHHSVRIIPNAGHFIWVEQPGMYVETIKAFLATSE